MNSEQVHLRIDPPGGPQGRLVTFFRGLMVLPHYLCILVLEIGLLFAVVIGWFAVLFTGQYPPAMFNYVVGVTRWATRVQAYYFLVTDQYPPFSLDDDPNYPVGVEVDYPARVERWRCIPGVLYLMAFPVLIVVYVMLIGAAICTVIAWFAIMFTGRYPQGFFDFVRQTMTWLLKIQLYILLINVRYPRSAAA